MLAHPSTAVTPVNVMRRRNVVTILITSELLIAGLLCFWVARHPAVTKPVISIGVLKYEPWAGKGSSILVRVRITNVGHRIITYNQFNFEGDAKVLTESQTGWTTRDIGGFAGGPSMPAVLKPGSTTTCLIGLPEGTLRWQVQYTVEVGSLRETVEPRIPPKLSNFLRPVFNCFLSDKRQLQYVYSSLFECPKHRGPTREAATASGLHFVAPVTNGE